MTRLSQTDAADALTYNRKKARTIGWMDRWAAVAQVLNMPPASVSGEGFAQHVCDWQTSHGRLTKDGKLGPSTWRAMEPATRMSAGTRPPPAWLSSAPAPSPVRPAPPMSGDAPWMDVARRQMNTHWRDNAGGYVRESETEIDKDYFAATPYFGGAPQPMGHRPRRRDADWCAAFVNFCLHTAGYSHTGSAGAASFVVRGRWKFRALTTPKHGCVIVVGQTSGAHVSFLDHWGDLPDDPGGDVRGSGRRDVFLLGGNQSNTVRSNEDRRNLISVRDAYGVTSPYLWPEIGPATCNCELPTARPHHCNSQWT